LTRRPDAGGAGADRAGADRAGADRAGADRVDAGEVVSSDPPWLAPNRSQALREFAREHAGIDPFDIVDLAVPEAGLVGAAFVLPVPTSPLAHGGHRVYLKRMLLAENAT